MVIYCLVNNISDFKKSEIKKLFQVCFEERGGYWSIIYNAHNLDEAKEMLRNERPNAKYKKHKKVVLKY